MARNAFSWVEIPVVDLDRAAAFYGAILGAELERMDLGATSMAILPAEEGGASGALLDDGGRTLPSAAGTLVYLNCEPDLQPVLDRVESAGGVILLAKSLITEEFGYYAVVADTEGNRVGLYSSS